SAALGALERAKSDVGFLELLHDEDIAKVSVVGAGMRSSAGVSAKLFTALYEAGVNMEMISTSEIRISVVTRAAAAATAARAIHTAFGLDGDTDAKVHAGTGR
ncbi:MAG TPA: ACT domain-containing protein, partial [Microbacteriaceae bacterium]|nr:ACT domain-containing protein [Microbacteriaceae bacterium]